MNSMLTPPFNQTNPPQGEGVTTKKCHMATKPLKLLSLFLLLTVAACSGNHNAPQENPPPSSSNIGKTNCNIDADCELAGGLCDKKEKVCVNPKTCNDTQSCLRGYQCTPKATCQKTLCTTPCAEGVCALQLNAQGKPYCTSKTKCTEATSAIDCVSPDVCYQDKCQNPDDVARQLRCGTVASPGIYDPSRSISSCVDAESCIPGQDDLKCKSGQCNPSTNKCLPNTCKDRQDICDTIGGTCEPDPTTTNGYKCKSATTCSQQKDCAKPDVCSNGKCVAAQNACDPACPGNQECDYNQSTLTGVCKENPNGCNVTRDCLAGRICVSGQCVDGPTDCGNGDPLDAKAANNDSSSASDYNTLSKTTLEKLYICADDADWFKYTAPKDGTLIITININTEDVGARKVIATLNNGTPYSNEENGQLSNTITIRKDSVKTDDTFTLEIKGDDTNKSSHVKVHYSLDIQVVPPNSIAACEPADVGTLEPNKGKIRESFANNNAQKGLSSSCVNHDGNIKSKVYKMVITERSYTVVTLTPEGGDLALSLRSSCFNASSEVENGCLDKASTDTPERFEGVLEAGEYYVVVTSSSFANQTNATYELVATSTPTTCSPNTKRTCSSAGILTLCNDTQTGTKTDNCNGNGCHEENGQAFCNGQKGSSCHNPFHVLNSGKKHISEKNIHIVDYGKSYTAGSQCNGLPSSSVTSGEDLVYKVTVDAGEAIIGKYTGYGQKSVYISESCDRFDQCVAAVADQDVPTTARDLHFYWKNDTNASKTVYIFFDFNNGPNYKPSYVDIDIDVRKPDCTPGELKCDPAKQYLLKCNSQGTAYDTSSALECTMGCDDSSDPPICKGATQGDTCNEAIDIKFSSGTYSKTIDLTSFKSSSKVIDGCGNIKYATANNDAVFKFNAQAGKIYTIKSTPNSSPNIMPLIWITKADSNSCLAPSFELKSDECVNASSAKISGKETEFTFTPNTTGEYYLVATIFNKVSASDSQTVDIEVDEKDQDGAPLSVKGCTSNVITYYDVNGKEKTINCQCNDGDKSCQNGDGKTCVSAKTLYDGSTTTSGTESGHLDLSSGDTLGTLRDSKKPYVVGQCLLDTENSLQAAPNGPDLFYKFDLKANQALTVDYTETSSTSSTTVAFFQEEGSCGDPLSCVGNRGGKESQKLYYATDNTPKTLYLVIKNTRKDIYFKPADFTIKWEVKDKTTAHIECAEGATLCDGNKVKVCLKSSLGNETKWKEYDCADGCQKGFCQYKSTDGKYCGDAIDAGKGGVFWIDSQDRNTSAALSTSCSAQLSSSLQDIDHYFLKVTTKPGDRITISSGSPAERSHKVILFKDCNDIANTCLGGAKGIAEKQSLNTETISYVTQSGGEYFIDVISVGLFNNTPFYVTIDVDTPACNSQNYKETCSSGVMTYCDAGSLKHYTCSSSGCDGNKCKTPQGDLCSDAIRIKKDTSTGKHDVSSSPYTLSTSGKHQFTTFLDGISGGCFLGTKKPTTSEKYFSIDLDKGETISFYLTDKNSYGYGYYQMYLLEDCSGKCLISHRNDPASSTDKGLTYTAHKSGNYTLVVTSPQTDPSKLTGFSLQYEITKQCVPGQGYCGDPNTLMLCDESHTIIPVSCTCENNFCVTSKKADSCDTAETIPSNFSTIVPLSRFSSVKPFASDPASLCPFSSTWSSRNIKGNDLFYKIKVPSYRTLKVSLYDSNMSGNQVVYLFTDCNAPNTSCLTTTQGEVGPFAHKEVTYTAKDTDEEIFIGVAFEDDGYSGAPPNTPIILNVELSGEACDPANDTPTCDDHSATTGKLSYCSPDSHTKTHYTCDGKCSGSVCTSPTGNSCVDPKVITFPPSTNTTTVSGDLSDATKNYTNKGNLVDSNVCTTWKTGGNDVIYSLTVPSGKKAKITLTSTASTKQNLALYAVTDCNKPADSCKYGFASKKDSNPRTIETDIATSETTYFIYVDSRDPLTSNGDYELKVELKDN